MIPRRILALDPGTSETGFVVLEHGRPVQHGILENSAVRDNLRIGVYPVDLLAVEMIASYGMPVGHEVFETCVWIGRFLEAAAHTRSVLVYRRDVKLTLCTSPRAKDPHVWQALVDLYGGEGAVGKKADPGPLYGVKSHSRAALGVAVTALAQIAGESSLTRGLLLGPVGV